MKNLITVLAIAALMTSCQKDELNGVTESEQITEVSGDWIVESMTSLMGSPLPVTIERVVIDRNLIFTYYAESSNLEDTIETFYAGIGQLHTETDRLIVSIDAEGKLTIKYTLNNKIVKATRN